MKATTSINSEIFDVEGAARYLGETVSVSTLNKMRTRGDGPQYVKVGHKVAYTKTNLDRYLAKHTQTSTSQNRPRAAGGVA
jgi:Helix-turn-helix domain